jgi:hypothetical protein
MHEDDHQPTNTTKKQKQKKTNQPNIRHSTNESNRSGGMKTHTVGIHVVIHVIVVVVVTQSYIHKYSLLLFLFFLCLLVCT